MVGSLMCEYVRSLFAMFILMLIRVIISGVALLWIIRYAGYMFGFIQYDDVFTLDLRDILVLGILYTLASMSITIKIAGEE